MWFRIKSKNRKELQSQHLSRYELQQLMQQLSTPQIECVEEVLLPFLERLRAMLRSNAKGEEVFTKRFEKVCQVLATIKATPELSSQSFSQQTQLKIITLFLVLRTLLNNLANELPIESKNNAFYAKRIPPNLRLFLSPESYRLFECYECIFGDLKSVQLNQDIVQWLHLGDKNPAEDSKKDKVPVTENRKIDEKNISDVAKATTPLPAEIAENNKPDVKELKAMPGMEGIFGKQEPKKSRTKPKQPTSAED